MMTVAELRAALAHYPDETLIVACDGREVLDFHGLETAADILRWHREHHTPAHVQQQLARLLSPDDIYLSLTTTPNPPWGARTRLPYPC